MQSLRKPLEGTHFVSTPPAPSSKNRCSPRHSLHCPRCSAPGLPRCPRSLQAFSCSACPFWGGDREQPATGPDLPNQTSRSHVSPRGGLLTQPQEHTAPTTGGRTTCRPTWPGFGTKRAGVEQERGRGLAERPRTRGVLVPTVQTRGPTRKNVSVVFVDSSPGPSSGFHCRPSVSIRLELLMEGTEAELYQRLQQPWYRQ